MSSKTILVVDDDAKMRRLLRRCFEGEGFDVAEASTEVDVLNVLRSNDICLITLDISLPGESGLVIARDVRQSFDVPIIMITGRDDVIDRVVGLEVGADDYITKPFHVREVVARVRALLRRAEGKTVPLQSKPKHAPKGRAIAFDGMSADPDTFELRDRDGKITDLTSGDFQLLTLFLDHPKRVLSRDQIMSMLKGTEWAPLDRTVDNKVARLRKKIERDPNHPRLIKTVRGIGYSFAADVFVETSVS